MSDDIIEDNVGYKSDVYIFSVKYFFLIRINVS